MSTEPRAAHLVVAEHLVGLGATRQVAILGSAEAHKVALVEVPRVGGEAGGLHLLPCAQPQTPEAAARE